MVQFNPAEESITMFNGILITKDDAGYRAQVQPIDEAVCRRATSRSSVEWSTLNYKDGLAITGKAPVVRRFPMVPGIDFAGTVIAKQQSGLAGGRSSVSSMAGASARRIAAAWPNWRGSRVNGWCALPKQFHGAPGDGHRHRRLHGHALRPGPGKARHQARDGEILVTGANGGVGSVAIALLAKLGYTVVASTGRVSKPNT
jgi:acrylyl-CoA reductase (NADPH)